MQALLAALKNGSLATGLVLVPGYLSVIGERLNIELGISGYRCGTVYRVVDCTASFVLLCRSEHINKIARMPSQRLVSLSCKRQLSP